MAATTQKPATQKPMYVSELLCYTTHKLGKLDVKQLKTIIANFYSLDVVFDAKEALVNIMDSLGIGKWPRPNTRRRKDSTGGASDVKLKSEIDDIIGVLTYVDEQNLGDRLPCFVAANPDMIPSSNWVSGDMTGIMNKFTVVENEFRSINDYIQRSTITQQETLRCVLESSKILSSKAAVGPRPTAPSLPPAGTHVKDGGSHCAGGAWSSLLATKDATTDEELDFSTVIGRKRKRMLTAGYAAASSNDVNIFDSIPKPSVGKRLVRMIGTAPSSVLLKAAKDLTRKEVFCISNADVDVTCDSIIDFVKSINVRVLNCFEAKTRVPKTKAFRICIDKSDRRAFLNKGNWPCNISVREWSFKSANKDKDSTTSGVHVDGAMSVDDEASCVHVIESDKLVTPSTALPGNIVNNTII